jgi:biopolymer transport protein ExbD/biopolymer transport protein TolR
MLAPKVKDLLTNKLDKTVFIKADQRSKYEVVLEVVQNLQAAGVDNVGMLTEQLQEKAKQAEGGAAAPAK